MALFAFHGVAEICEATGCNLKTAYHWRSGVRVPGPRTLKLWRLYRDEQVLTVEFRGFRIRGAKLITPAGLELTAAELQWYQFALAHAADMARRLGPDEQARWWNEVMARAPAVA